MSTSRADTRVAHFSMEQSALLRCLLLCEIAARADGVADRHGWLDPAIGDAEDALRRLEDGTYGSCDRCARPIAFERLAATPRTRHCVRCA